MQLKPMTTTQAQRWSHYRTMGVFKFVCLFGIILHSILAVLGLLVKTTLRGHSLAAIPNWELVFEVVAAWPIGILLTYACWAIAEKKYHLAS
mgnify:FL=1